MCILYYIQNILSIQNYNNKWNKNQTETLTFGQAIAQTGIQPQVEVELACTLCFPGEGFRRRRRQTQQSTTFAMKL
jgi:hypothetical protein